MTFRSTNRDLPYVHIPTLFRMTLRFSYVIFIQIMQAFNCSLICDIIALDIVMYFMNIDSNYATIDYTIMSCHILQELPITTLPLLNTIRSRGGKCELLRACAYASHSFLVMSERGHGLAGSQVPQFNRAVVTSGDDLGIYGVGNNGRDSIGVTPQNVNFIFCPNVPHPRHRVSSTCH